MRQGRGGSRGLAIGRAAVVRATAKVRDKGRRIAAHMLEAAPKDIVLDPEAGCYDGLGLRAQALTRAQIADRAYSDDLPDYIDCGPEATDLFRPPDLLYPFDAEVAVVEIERATDVTYLRESVSVDLCGPRISPMLVAGQAHGGLARGIAQALLEDDVYDEQGHLPTGSLMDYAVPRADQFPQFVTHQTVTNTPHNPLGAKGIGKAPATGSNPALVHAVMDALDPFGVRHIDMSLRLEKIWRAMRAGAATGAGRDE